MMKAMIIAHMSPLARTKSVIAVDEERSFDCAQQVLDRAGHSGAGHRARAASGQLLSKRKRVTPPTELMKSLTPLQVHSYISTEHIEAIMYAFIACALLFCVLCLPSSTASSSGLQPFG